MTGTPERRGRARLRVRRPERFTPGDFYGLTAEARVVESRAREVFTPHQPIFESNRLHGRDPEVQRMIQALNTPGLHVVLCGPDGIGKTSVANVVAELMRKATTTRTTVKRCDGSDTFETIVQEPLAAVGVDVLRVESVLQVAETHKAEARLANVGGGRERQRTTSATYRPDATMGPAEAATHLNGSAGLLVIDDVHTVREEERHKVAAFGKHLGESKSGLKLLAVGTARSATDLFGTASKVREVCLSTLCPQDVHELVTTGVEALGMTVDESVIAAIAELSAGLPQFAHLLGLTCVETAIGTGRKHIAERDLPLAVATAVADADPALKLAYEEANCPNVLTRVASVPHTPFTLDDLRADGGPARLPDRIVSDDGTTIVQRTDRGVYRFSDARMRSYVRIRHLLLKVPTQREVPAAARA